MALSLQGAGTGAAAGAAMGTIFGPIGTGIGALIGGGIGLVGDFINYQEQSEQQDYERALQQTIFAREDTAVQRRAADLEAAGLSRTLAAGSAAQAGAVVKSQPPQFQADNARAGAQLAMQVAQTKAEIDLKRAQTRAVEQETDWNAKTFDDRVRVAAEAARTAGYVTLQNADKAIMTKIDTEQRLSFQNYLQNNYNLTEGEAKAMSTMMAYYKLWQERQNLGTVGDIKELEKTWKEYENNWYKEINQVPGTMGYVSREAFSVGSIIERLLENWRRARGN